MVSPSQSGERARSCPASPSDSSAASEGRQASPLQPLLRDLTALRSHVGEYITARADGVRAGARKALAWTVLGALGGIVALVIVSTASAVLVQGIARGLAVLLGDRLWAGQLLAGTLILATIGGGAWWFVSSWLRSSYQRTKAMYERREQEQHNGREGSATLRERPRREEAGSRDRVGVFSSGGREGEGRDYRDRSTTR